MKALIKYFLGFFLFLGIQTYAQEAGTHSAIPAKNTAKGRRELRKDKRVKRHEHRLEKSNTDKLETKSDRGSRKKSHRKAPKEQKRGEEVMKKD